MTPTPSRARRLVTVVAAAVAVLLTLAGFGAPSASAAASPDPTDKVSAAAEQRLTQNKTADFWVRMTDKADLSKASQVADWNQRGTAVYDALRSHATASQAKVVAQLKAASADYTPYWITNAVLVRGGTLGLANSIAANPDVKEIVETSVLELIKPVDQKPSSGSMGTQRRRVGHLRHQRRRRLGHRRDR